MDNKETDHMNNMLELGAKVEKAIQGYEINTILRILSGMTVGVLVKCLIESQDETERRFLIDVFNDVVLASMKKSFDQEVKKLSH